MSEGSFEAKLHGFRRTQDGVVVSYTVHPNDVSAELATAALGTRYMIGFAELGDGDQPKNLGPDCAAIEARSKPHGEQEVRNSASAKDRRKFTNLPLSQQAAMRCQEGGFQAYLRCNSKKDVPSVVRALCGVESRSDIVIDTPAGDKWCQLEIGYQSWLTDTRYQDCVR